MRSSTTTIKLFALTSLCLTWILAFSYRDTLFGAVAKQLQSVKTGDNPEGVIIKNKVATITDTVFTHHLVPLILHFHAVLGPSWPIVFYTSQATYDKHFSANATTSQPSAAWRRAVAARSVEIRILPSDFDLTSRKGVNLYFSNPWMWEQLAPASNVLVFQADAIICANANRTVDDFLVYDFIGAPLNDTRKVYNGGLSLRNRTMLLEILHGERNWWDDWNTKGTEYGGHGEDVWMSILMRDKMANLPTIDEALHFSKQLPWHFKTDQEPIGYHRVYKEDQQYVPKARKLCPEIDLSSPGLLN